MHVYNYVAPSIEQTIQIHDFCDTEENVLRLN